MKRTRRFAYLCIAMGSIGVGMLGIILPILPTTPFLLVALWATGKSSPRLEAWLLEHKRYGPLLTAWRQRQAIPTTAKWFACTMMLLSGLILWQTGWSILTLIICGLMFIAVACYILTRPSY